MSGRHHDRNASRAEIGAAAWAAYAIAGAALLQGCAHYEAKPIAPASTLDAFDARRLTDAGLARIVAEEGHTSDWPPEVWDLDSLTEAALYFSPKLASARAAWGVARAALVTANARPDPTVLGFGPGYNTSTDPAVITPWIFNLQLDFTIETAGKRRHRSELAQRQAEAARYDAAAAAWKTRSSIRQALVEQYSATRTSEIQARQLTIGQRNVVLFERRLQAGEISSFEMAQARLQLDTARLALSDAKRQQQAARARLAEAIGLPATALEDVRLGLDRFAEAPRGAPGEDARRAALLNRTDILAALARYEASQSSLQLEIARQHPDVHLGPGYQMDQGSNKWTLLAFPTFLPIVNRNRGPIAEAEARRAAAAKDFEAVQAAALNAVDLGVVNYKASEATLSVAEEILSEIRSEEQTSERQRAEGVLSELDLGVVQVELATRELARLQTLVQLQTAAGELEDAMQRPMDFPVDPLPKEP